MNKYILILCLALFFWGCEQNDIDVYNQTPRLTLPYSLTYSFNDADYVNKRTEGVGELEVRLMGNVLKETRTFCLKMEKDSVNINYTPSIELEDKYEFAVDTTVTKVAFKIQRPEQIGVQYSAFCYFDEENPAHEFDRGDAEYLQAKISVIFNIRPNGWDDYWGLYSNAKYCFMMDHWNVTYDKMEKTISAKAEIRRAYDAYKRENGPLYDDEPEHNEIVFPE
ncbi:MAG: hypothetical protein ACLTSL_17250 [Odoribacter splanchnicus]